MRVEYAYFDGHTMQEQLYIEQMATEVSLVHAGHPVTGSQLGSVCCCTGGLFYLYEALTIFVANLFNVNPYDQPGVEEGKKIAYSLLGREDHLPRQKEYQEMLDAYLKESRVFIVK